MSTTPRKLPSWLPILVLLISMISIQSGASLAKSLFPLIGAPGVTALRLALGTLILVVVFKPWRLRFSKEQRLPLLFYGLSLGAMNYLFYLSLQRIPLGIAVALEFTGPLAIAMLGSRRLIDFLWIALAVGGLLLLLPIHEFSGNLDPVGVAFALGAGFCWAMYIFFGKRAGNAGGGASVSLGMIVGACAILPFGVASAGTSMFSMSVLPLALLLGVFSSALPYGLEIVALKQLPAQTFGILMSMEPVLAALSGIIFLGEQLNVAQWVALACIIVASIGATLTIRRKA